MGHEAAMNALPEWANAALESFAPVPPFGESAPNPSALDAHAALVGRIEEAWPALSKRVVRELSAMGAERARDIFEHMVWLLKYFRHNEWFKEDRRRKRELSELNQAIKRKAADLADLVERTRDLADSWGMVAGSPDMLDCLARWHGSALHAPKFAAWSYVAANDFHRFMVIARTQSRPRPGLAEFLAEVAADIDPRDEPLPQSRKSTSDLRRALLEGIDQTDPSAPPDSRLTHEAVADVLTVLFGDVVAADDIRKLRGAR
jgi:hypothetical protein